MIDFYITDNNEKDALVNEYFYILLREQPELDIIREYHIHSSNNISMMFNTKYCQFDAIYDYDRNLAFYFPHC